MFRQVGDDRYSCVAPPGFDVNPAALAAIHEFDPGAIPIWRIQLWMTPWSPVSQRVVHHGIGRYYPIPRYLRKPFHVDMPADADFPAPNFLDAIFEDENTLLARMGGPGYYIPFGWNVYYWCRWQFDRITESTWAAAVDRRVARLQKLTLQWEDEIAYRKRDFEKWAQKKIDAISDVEWKQYLELAWGPKPKGFTRRQPKPFADLGRSPQPGRTYGRVAPG